MGSVPLSSFRNAGGAYTPTALPRDKNQDVKTFHNESPTRTPPNRISRSVGLPHIRTPGSPGQAKVHVDIGSHTQTGRKHHRPDWTNQDISLTKPLPDNKLLVAVFDGHGSNGHKVSHRAKDLFSQMCPTFVQNVKNIGAGAAFAKLFGFVHEVLRNDGLSQTSGSTCTCALLDLGQKELRLANVGDSTGVLLHHNGVVCVTRDHKFDEESEERINAAGGEVRVEGIPRIFAKGTGRPGLALSRSLGDIEASEIGVLCEPEVSTALKFEAGNTLIVASDGVWDMLSPNKAADLVTSSPDAQIAAEALIEEASALWPDEMDRDDMTVIVVRAL
jgi:serine/threonine protein phosphatase PrpC